MAPWRTGGRYQVWRGTPVQTLAGEQLVLPMGFAEVEPIQPGFRIQMPLEHVRVIVSDQEFARLVHEGQMRKL